ncbi:MAG: MIP/aquaporin family protein [Rothia sp. (in: high G+C Gram-positive bacteria)]|uniref:MIP/aquaporin family protein n=1 Tax=Rothia sp. (in: high G+C Gram-positive bacteria) TaxID=1885016 RepID=UPI0026E0B130|nr:MIP/aquaporin family protein [Rothia sp. (in: high G+C Gram-positive bacteria)]MDO5751035.1 MIP/aquaporin family protein [Rothia sp. (in: high G+C Gram-positive bacteria)]
MSLLASTSTVIAAAAEQTVAATPTTMGLFASEFFGTMILILLGAGVCAAVTLPKSFAKNAGWVVISFAWGFAVFTAVYLSFPSGAHLNPAVTLGLATAGRDLATNVPATGANIGIYLAAQFLGAFVGAVLAFLAYKKHFDDDSEPGSRLGIFATGPAIKSYGWNLVTEALGTFVLVAWVLASGKTPAEIGPLGVALVVVSIGMSLGGATGYAINPARDLAPRFAHFILPIKGKGDSNWSYAWVPVLGPVIGGVLAGLLVPVFLPI